MNSAAFLVLLFSIFVSALAAPQPEPHQGIPEDPEPVTTVTSCGGLLETTSAIINFQVGGSIRADMRCLWIVNAPYDTQRFSLVSSGLNENDGLFVTAYGKEGPGLQYKVASLGQNHTFVSRTVLVTLNVGHAPTFGFSLKFFSSGSAGAVAITGYIGLTTARGNLSYPLGGGNYQNSESALITITPTVPGKPTLRFTFVDMEGASCLYDYVRTFTWFENTYSQVARFCGTTIPTSLTLAEGVGLVSFTSDASVTGPGFAFEWE
ncbi:cubilin isoform X1 [Folsomia candida]|uniref:Cubilin n=1 Tax=Folsomia candida TaxID=158441 RepID=A0A226EZA5_FOLCA|nr:cubilin isoform X1 [Folsomia candida]OXA62869.1 Cubilin [Folsomia candida]